MERFYEQLVKYLRWTGLALDKQAAEPVYIVFFVTSSCNARCRHCFVPSLRPTGVPLSAAEIERLSHTLGSCMHTLVLTGGEPFLREDFAEICMSFLKNADLTTLRIATNGSLPERIAEWATRLTSWTGRTRIIVGLSLDGKRDLHDSIRRSSGLYDRAITSLRYLQNVSRKLPFLDISVTITVSKFNVDHVGTFIEYLLNEIGVRNVMTNLVRGTTVDPECTQLDVQKYAEIEEKMSKLLQSGIADGYRGFADSDFVNAQNIVVRRRSVELLSGKASLLRCTAGRISGVIFADGTVAPCELTDMTMADLRSYGMNLHNLWRSTEARDTRNRLLRRQCECTHECSGI